MVPRSADDQDESADVNAYVQRRQERGAAAASINRELAILKRAFTLAIRAGKLLPAHRPYIAMLREHNVRTGFFEAAWRVHSEVLPLEWRNVDLKAGTVTLDVGSTKNGEGRTIYMTAALRTLLEAQKAASEALAKTHETITPRVFHRTGKPIKNFYKAWRSACQGAGCLGQAVARFRRTAVRNYVRAGIPERVSMAMSGHKTGAPSSIATTSLT